MIGDFKKKLTHYFLKKIFKNKNDYFRISPLLICKEDCVFKELLEANFTNNIPSFCRNVMASLRSDAANQCPKLILNCVPDYKNVTFSANTLITASSKTILNC